MSGPLQAETLAEAIALAYRNNPTLQSNRYDLRAADENLVQARAELRPTADLQLTGAYDRTIDGRTTAAADPFSPSSLNRNSNQAQLAITQPLYTGGRATADRRVAEAGIRSSREMLRSAEGDLLLGVITAYVDVRRYSATLGVLKSSVTELEKLTKEIEARKVAGELTRTDIAQAESQLDLARQQVASTEESFESARADYAALVGRTPGSLEPEPPLPQMPASVDDAFDLAVRRNPDLAQARYTELGSRSQIVVAKSAGQPTISLRGTATLSGQAIPYRLRDQDQGYVGSVVFSLPLSAGGRIASQVRQAEYRNGSDRLKIEAARRTVMHNVSTAWNQIVTAERVSRLLDAQGKAAATQLEGMIAEYRVGLRSTFDVLYAQQSLRDAQVSALAAQRDKYVSAASLLRQTGLLEARAITTGVSLYDPTEHLRDVEHRNALPWDGVVATIDRAGAPSARQYRLTQPAAPSGEPKLASPANSLPPDADLSRFVPDRPTAGTIGQPSSTPGRELH